MEKEITKSQVADWLEDFISKNPYADTFELAMAAIKFGYEFGKDFTNMFDHPELFCQHDMDLVSDHEEKIMREWIEKEASHETLEKLVDMSISDYYNACGVCPDYSYREFCIDYWNDLSHEEKKKFYLKYNG